eukprot:scaffold731_cov261-Pinguiococcus_pyrenoidosus.AAC.44
MQRSRAADENKPQNGRYAARRSFGSYGVPPGFEDKVVKGAEEAQKSVKEPSPVVETPAQSTPQPFGARNSASRAPELKIPSLRRRFPSARDRDGGVETPKEELTFETPVAESSCPATPRMWTPFRSDEEDKDEEAGQQDAEAEDQKEEEESSQEAKSEEVAEEEEKETETATETEAERLARELQESEALARELMAEEAMHAYSMAQEALLANADQYSEADLQLLRAMVAEEAPDAEDLDESASEEDDNVNSEDLDYDRLLQLGEVRGRLPSKAWGKHPSHDAFSVAAQVLGDVREERWRERAEAAIRRLPVREYTKELSEPPTYNNSRCVVCQCDFEDKEKVRILPCSHFFHVDCVDEWLRRKDTCPCCMKSIEETPEEHRAS